MLQKSGIPIIFVQALLDVGAEKYADIALRQAARASPDSDVILLTDVERPGLPEIRQFALADHRCAVTEFERLYRHASVNDFRYELLCFTRWFYVRDFVRRHGIGRFCMFDTDIMLFFPVESFAAEFGDRPAGNWSWANTICGLDGLDLICGHFETIFRDPVRLQAIAEKYSIGLTPHVSDMFALFDLGNRNPTLLDQHSLCPRGFDDNIHSSAGGLFVMDGPIKSLMIGTDGIPRAKRNGDGADVPFHFLHFQGLAKDLMPKFAWPVIRSSEDYSLGPRIGEIDRPTDTESENAMLRRRIAALEHEVRNLREMVTPLLRHSWRAKFSPKLYQWVQYDPREVVELTAAVAEASLPSPAPRIAIVTPSYNYADFLGDTVKSVITQTYPNLTYVVQDNNSTDGSAKLLASIAQTDLVQEPRRLIVRSEADRGQADAINRGFAQVPDAEIMAYLNADDILLPGTLSFVASTFLREPAVDVVYGHRIFIDANGWETGRCVLPNHDRHVIKWMDYIPQETMFWRRRVWDRVGPFDESFRFAIDWDFILRAHDQGFRFKRLPRFLGCFRWHDRQKTSALLKVGADEQKRLRRRHLGYDPSGKEIGREIKGYLRRHVLFHRAYKLRLLGINP